MRPDMGQQALMNDVCPSCGAWTDYLGELTGWCADCETTFGAPASKPCIKCGHTKPLTGFYPHPNCRDGYRNICKACSTLERREWRRANLDRDNENWRRLYHRRKAACTA